MIKECNPKASPFLYWGKRHQPSDAALLKWEMHQIFKRLVLTNYFPDVPNNQLCSPSRLNGIWWRQKQSGRGDIFLCSWPWTQIRTEHECRGKICPQFRQPERLEPQLTALVDPGRPQSISEDARQLVEAWTWTKWRRTSITILISSSFNLCRGLFALLCRDDLSRFPSAIRHRLTALFQQIEHTSQGSGLCQPPILRLYFFFLSCSLSGFKAVLLILLHSSFHSVF